MATKKSAKSSKTAHVLNILSNSQQEGEPLETAREGGMGQAPLLELAHGGDTALSDAIRSSLSQELAPAPEPALQTAHAAEPAPTSEPAPKPASPAPAKPMPEPEQEIAYINVMQALVEEQFPKYIRMFGKCDCARCRADIKAFALSNLPAKYIVAHPGSVIPTLSVYESRYSASIIAQLFAACKAVGERPRH